MREWDACTGDSVHVATKSWDIDGKYHTIPSSYAAMGENVKVLVLHNKTWH